MRTRRATALLAALALAVPACSGDDDETDADGAPTATAQPPPGGSAATIGTDGSAPPTGAAATTAAATATSAAASPPASVIDDTQAVGGTLVATVDLDTGEATVTGRTGEDVGVLGVAAGGDGRLTGLTDAPALVTVPAGDPAGVLAGVPVTGVEGSTLLAIDAAADGALLALDDGGALWTVDAGSGAARRIGPPGGPLVDPGVGFDVDPTDGSVVVADASGTHLRLDPGTAAVTESPAIAWSDGDGNAAVPPRVVAVAHAADGTRYAIEASSGSLVLLDDGGRLTTVGPLGVDVTDGAALDVGPDGVAVLTSPG